MIAVQLRSLLGVSRSRFWLPIPIFRSFGWSPRFRSDPDLYCVTVFLYSTMPLACIICFPLYVNRKGQLACRRHYKKVMIPSLRWIWAILKFCWWTRRPWPTVYLGFQIFKYSCLFNSRMYSGKLNFTTSVKKQLMVSLCIGLPPVNTGYFFSLSMRAWPNSGLWLVR